MTNHGWVIEFRPGRAESWSQSILTPGAGTSFDNCLRIYENFHMRFLPHRLFNLTTRQHIMLSPQKIKP